jgi:hypothetical protein
MQKLTGTLVFVSVQKPVKAYVKPGAEAKPDEWKASVVLTDEDEVDAFEEYAKTGDTQVSVKKVKAAEFESIYKIPAPEGAGKNVWVVTFRKSTMLGKTGNPVPDLYRPKVFEKIGKNTVEITNSKLVGNGSKGSISIDRFDRQAGGFSLYLKNVLVTDLVEYEASDSYVPGSEFDDEAGDDSTAPETKPESTKQAKKPAAKKQATDDSDDDVPF